MITIIDYGVGNIQAFLNAYNRLSIPAATARTSDELRSARKLILPGVGAFDNAVKRLEDSGMRAMLDELVLHKGVPVLGVCVGMQMLVGSSEEGVLPGLGWMQGRVASLRGLKGASELPLPHMGWNDVRPVSDNGVFAHLDVGPRFYFLHSFYLEDIRDEDTLATSNYGSDFCVAVRKDNIFGVQFHPEKSHQCGTRLLKTFAEL